MDETMEPADARGGRPYNAEQTLIEVASGDLWQWPVVSADGAPVGRVIRQVVEPRASMVRYLVVFDPERARHYLLPTSALAAFDSGTVRCALPRGLVERIPPLGDDVDRAYEEAVYRALERAPHWVEDPIAW